MIVRNFPGGGVRSLFRRVILGRTSADVTWLATPFKVGSEALFATLTGPKFFEGGHVALVQGPIRSGLCRHFTIKAHTDGRSLRAEAERLGIPLTRVLTLFRAPEEIYLSALFQDLTNPAYPYAFGSESEVLAARPEDLRDHFFRFDWSSFPFLSLRVNSRSIAECTGYEWLERVRDDGHRAWVWNGPVTLGVAHLSALEVRSEWCRFLDAAGLGACTRTPSIPDVNRGDAKWYREQYVNTRRLVQVDPRFALLQRDARSDLPRAVVEILDRDYRREVVR